MTRAVTITRDTAMRMFVPACEVGVGPDKCPDRLYCSSRKQPMCGAYIWLDLPIGVESPREVNYVITTDTEPATDSEPETEDPPCFDCETDGLCDTHCWECRTELEQRDDILPICSACLAEMSDLRQQARMTRGEGIRE